MGIAFIVFVTAALLVWHNHSKQQAETRKWIREQSVSIRAAATPDTQADEVSTNPVDDELSAALLDGVELIDPAADEVEPSEEALASDEEQSAEPEVQAEADDEVDYSTYEAPALVRLNPELAKSILPPVGEARVALILEEQRIASQKREARLAKRRERDRQRREAKRKGEITAAQADRLREALENSLAESVDVIE